MEGVFGVVWQCWSCHCLIIISLLQITGGFFKAFPFLRYFVSKEKGYNVILSGFTLVNEFVEVNISRDPSLANAGVSVC